MDLRSLVEGTVTTIDGQPALQDIQKFTDRVSAISKDPGVHLNDDLASTSWNSEWGSSPGGSASRWEVPKKLSVDYKSNVELVPSDLYELDQIKDAKSY
ncbi:hypothetical protein BGX27_007801 [Mortierella sp. AM989]|nr:hypothetical protein BGX27_007801 [Mortierella sp. AM989]